MAGCLFEGQTRRDVVTAGVALSAALSIETDDFNSEPLSIGLSSCNHRLQRDGCMY